MTGLTVGDIPRGDEIELMNKILAEGRGLTEEQRFSLLVKRFQENSELPRSFRTRRGPAIRWSEDEDRKSTRLNSSHKPISYAVFCLKEKKTV